MGRQNWKGRKRPNRGQWGDEVFLEALRAVGKQSETEREAARTKAAAAMAVALGRAGRRSR